MQFPSFTSLRWFTFFWYLGDTPVINTFLGNRIMYIVQTWKKPIYKTHVNSLFTIYMSITLSTYSWLWMYQLLIFCTWLWLCFWHGTSIYMMNALLGGFITYNSRINSNNITQYMQYTSWSGRITYSAICSLEKWDSLHKNDIHFTTISSWTRKEYLVTKVFITALFNEYACQFLELTAC